MRDDLAVIACGPFIERPEGIADDRLFALPAPDPVPMTAASLLRQAAAQVGAHLVSGRDVTAMDGRSSLRTSISSLAVLLGSRVDGIEIGAAAGSRTLATADGETRHAVIATAGLLPHSILDDEEAADAVLSWSTSAADPALRLDRLRELALHPWAETIGRARTCGWRPSALPWSGSPAPGMAPARVAPTMPRTSWSCAAAASRRCRRPPSPWPSRTASGAPAHSPSCTTTRESWPRSARCPSRAIGDACWPTSWTTASCPWAVRC
jgi:hypothetical protein